jgi:NAD kinase
MSATTERRLVVVVRPTRLEELVARFNTVAQARFYVESLGADFADYLAEHERYRAALGDTETAMRALGRVHRLQRAHLPNYLFGPTDIVLALGQDGLVANTLKYLDGQAVIGVNPDPGRWDGVLLPFAPCDVGAVARDHLGDRRPVREITMAQARLNDGQALYGVNDLFIGPRSHVSARYLIAMAGRQERQSSSGIIVSTGLGSTGWLRSLYAGWAGMTRALVGSERPPATEVESRFDWEARELRFCVREPFPSRSSQAELVFGRLGDRTTLTITSLMPENGTIFSDGIEADCLAFNSGAIATIGVASRRGRLVV